MSSSLNTQFGFGQYFAKTAVFVLVLVFKKNTQKWRYLYSFWQNGIFCHIPCKNRGLLGSSFVYYYLLNIWEFVNFVWAYLLLNAVSYDGEILHTDAWRPCAGHVLGFMSIGVVVTQIMTFSTNACILLLPWPQVSQWNIGSRPIAAGQQCKAYALLLIAQALQQRDVTGYTYSYSSPAGRNSL